MELKVTLFETDRGCSTARTVVYSEDEIFDLIRIAYDRARGPFNNATLDKIMIDSVTL